MATSFDPSMTYRRLWQTDADAVLQHLLRLPPESRQQRFGMAVSDEFIRLYAGRSFSHDDVIYGFLADGVLRGLGELRPVSPGRMFGIGGDMEAAFSVEPEWQRKGVASELMRLVVQAARVRCAHTLYCSCLSRNTAMQKLARKFSAELQFDAGDVSGKLYPAPPGPFAFWRKSVDDAASFAIAVMDLQRNAYGRTVGN